MSTPLAGWFIVKSVRTISFELCFCSVFLWVNLHYYGKIRFLCVVCSAFWFLVMLFQYVKRLEWSSVLLPDILIYWAARLCPGVLHSSDKSTSQYILRLVFECPAFLYIERLGLCPGVLRSSDNSIYSAARFFGCPAFSYIERLGLCPSVLHLFCLPFLAVFLTL